MNDRVKGIIVLFILATIFLGGGFIGVPRVLGALPGEYRIRLARIPLMEQLLEIGTTPLPAALPAPSIVAGRQQVTIPALLPATATPTLEATGTRDLMEMSATDVSTIPTTTATPSPSPTATPIPLPTQSRIVGLEIIPQGFNNCGPANLTINLNFYGEATTQNEAAAFLKPTREDQQ